MGVGLDAGGGQRIGRFGEAGEGHDRVGVAVDQQDRRRRAAISDARRSGSQQAAGEADDAGERLGPPAEADVERHHRALAEADEQRCAPARCPAPRRRRASASRSPKDRTAATRATASGVPSSQGIGNHWKPAGLPGQRSGAFGARKRGVRKVRRERLGEADQVVAVGAVAVQEDHQAVGGARRPRARRGRSGLSSTDPSAERVTGRA